MHPMVAHTCRTFTARIAFAVRLMSVAPMGTTIGVEDLTWPDNTQQLGHLQAITTMACGAGNHINTTHT